MLYKGGPKNYSKGDWLFFKVLGAVFLIALVLVLVIGPQKSSDRMGTSYPNDVDQRYHDIAEQHGYSGKDADDVARGAKALCQGAAGSNC